MEFQRKKFMLIAVVLLVLIAVFSFLVISSLDFFATGSFSIENFSGESIWLTAYDDKGNMYQKCSFPSECKGQTEIFLENGSTVYLGSPKSNGPVTLKYIVIKKQNGTTCKIDTNKTLGGVPTVSINHHPSYPPCYVSVSVIYW